MLTHVACCPAIVASGPNALPMGRWGSNPTPCECSMLSMTCTRTARTPPTHSKGLDLAQDSDCRRMSPRKTSKSLHYKRIRRLGRGIQTHEPRYFNGLPGRAPIDVEARHQWTAQWICWCSSGCRIEVFRRLQAFRALTSLGLP